MGKLALAAKITHVPSMYLSELPGARHGSRQDAIDGHIEIGRRCREALVERRDENLAFSTDGAHPVDGPRPCAREHPGLRRAARRIVRRRGLPAFPEHLLEDVGRVRGLAHDADDERIRERGVPVVEARERVAIAARHAPDEVRSERAHAHS